LTRWKKKQHGYYHKAIVFLLALLPRLIFSLQACPVRILSDEVATMSGGAFFAGLDWSRVISHAGYYGVGFSLFTAPFFVLTDNPFIIYRGISVTCAVLQAATAPVCFHLMETYFDVKDVKLKYLLSFSASFMVATRATVIYNEHIMIFLTWVLVWILLKLHSCVEDRLHEEENRSRLRGFLFGTLSRREREILLYRYGLYGYPEITQREIADRFQISRSYVSRIEKKALAKLRACYELENTI